MIYLVAGSVEIVPDGSCAEPGRVCVHSPPCLREEGVSDKITERNAVRQDDIVC